MDNELMVVVPLKDYTELVEKRAIAESDNKHLFSRICDLQNELSKLRQRLDMKGDDLK